MLIQSVSRFQGLAPVRASAVADVLRTDLRRLHKVMEISAAAQDRTGLQVRPEAVADWRDS